MLAITMIIFYALDMFPEITLSTVLISGLFDISNIVLGVLLVRPRKEK